MTFIKRWLIRRGLLDKFVVNAKTCGFGPPTVGYVDVLGLANNSGSEGINFSFEWSRTEEGWAFWRRINDSFREDYKRFHEITEQKNGDICTEMVD